MSCLLLAGEYYSPIECVFSCEAVAYNAQGLFEALRREKAPTFTERRQMPGPVETPSSYTLTLKKAMPNRFHRPARDGQSSADTETENEMCPMDIFGIPDLHSEMGNLVPVTYDRASVYSDVARCVLALEDDAKHDIQQAIHGTQEVPVPDDPFPSDSDSSSSSSSSESEYSDDDTDSTHSRETRRHRNHSKSRRKKKKKHSHKKKRSTVTILREMQKTFSLANFQKLSWDDSDLNSRLRNYDAFVRHLQNILMHHKELQHCLMMPGEVFEAKTREAECALYSLIRNNCDNTYALKIDNYTQSKREREGPSKDLYCGSEIPTYLRQLILSDDPSLLRHARQQLERVRIQSGESLARFNNRFIRALHDFEIRGGSSPPKEKVRIYFDALVTADPHLKQIVKIFWLNVNASRHEYDLCQIHARLQAEETRLQELTGRTRSRQSPSPYSHPTAHNVLSSLTSSPGARPNSQNSGRGSQQSRSSARGPATRPNQSPRQSTRSSTTTRSYGPCFNCGRTGHSYSRCPTISDARRDEIRRQQHQAGVQRSTQAPGQSRPPAYANAAQPSRPPPRPTTNSPAPIATLGIHRVQAQPTNRPSVRPSYAAAARAQPAAATVVGPPGAAAMAT
jgi:hypothetical protein